MSPQHARMSMGERRYSVHIEIYRDSSNTFWHHFANIAGFTQGSPRAFNDVLENKKVQ